MTVPFVAAAFATVLAMLGLGVVAVAHLRGFLAAVPSIDTEDDLDAYRRVAAWNIYGALVFLGLSVVWGGAVFAEFAFGNPAWTTGTMISMIVFGPLLTAVGLYVRKLESRVQATPATDEFLAERDRVTHVWMHKPLPDW